MASNFTGTPEFSGSAKIYTFPPRGRFALRVDDTASVRRPELPRGAELVTGSGWYHDEAIQAETPRKN
jgi:Protein of unknown function (DUF2735)